MSEHDLTRRAGWVHHPHDEVAGPLDYVMKFAAAADASPPMLHLVYTDDGLYVPALVRKPEGAGPFPLVIALHGGSGGLGISYLANLVTSRGLVFDRLLAEGYAVCVAEGRMEHEDAYGTDFPGVLDHNDIVTVLRHMQRQSFVDPHRIGFFGVSHGGELQMKLITEIGQSSDVLSEMPLPAALVPTEPAVIEFLGLRYEGVRKEANLQFNAPISDDQIDIARAMARIEKISPSLPILVIGRDEDHLQGPFRKLYELLRRAGKNAEWVSFSHPEHAYQFGPRRGADGYRPDPVQQATLETVVAFLNKQVRDKV
jgi:acetyl esterase/lipase